MSLWFYSLLMWLAQPWLRRKLRRRGMAEPLYLQAMDERFGVYANAPARTSARPVWIHAVSLGETRAAAILLERLRQQLPGMQLLLTHGTATGRAQGVKLLRPGDLQAWLPWDTPAAVAGFLNHFNPRIGILLETEVWPNLVHICQRRATPLVLVNARLSEKSLQRALQLAWLARPAYRGLHAVWAQTSADAARLQRLGAKVQGTLGNLKFDARPNTEQLARASQWRQGLPRPVVMFASSRAGEEKQLLEVLREHRATLSAPDGQAPPDALQWLIVPRHPQRFDEVAALIQAHGFALSRRSNWDDGPPATNDAIWLGDSLGEMALYYGLADVALLGGSFAPLGGQNLIEAAACACPVIMGPHTFNFMAVAELAQSAGAALRCVDLTAALVEASALCSDVVKLARAKDAAQAFAASQSGAAKRLAQEIERLLR